MSASLILRARAIIGSKTPIKADCGRLCGKLCCRKAPDQAGQETGMLLFPGEEPLFPLFAGAPGFTVRQTALMGKPALMAVCSGRCRRENRPLSCRIFPFAPYENGDGSITVNPDPRAIGRCPLLSRHASEHIDPQFIFAIQKAFAFLSEDAVFHSFLQGYSAMQDEYKRFTGAN